MCRLKSVSSFLSVIFVFVFMDIFLKNKVFADFHSPCNDIFIYAKNNGEIVGLIKVQGTKNGDNTLEIQLRLDKRFTIEGNIGRIVQRNPANVINDVLNNIPINFIVLFPTQDPVPELEFIRYNGKVICSGEADHNSHSILLKKILNLDIPQLPSNINNEEDIAVTEKIIHQSIIPTYTNVDDELNINKYECGKRKIFNDTTALTVNGFDTYPGEWPWIVGIFSNEVSRTLQYHCSGTIISENVVITAAHCVKPKTSQYVKASLHNYKDVEKGTVTMFVQRVEYPRQYRPEVSYQENADVAALILGARLVFNDYIIPACLWSGLKSINLLEDHIGYVVGWGADETGLPSTEEPKLAVVQITSQANCKQTYVRNSRYIRKGKFCAGAYNHGPCNGDSGAGLMLVQGNHYELRGIVSFSKVDGLRRCDLTQHVVYTDAAYYTKWMRDVIERNN